MKLKYQMCPNHPNMPIKYHLKLVAPNIIVNMLHRANPLLLAIALPKSIKPETILSYPIIILFNTPQPTTYLSSHL
jgi:hypothetical protein